MDKDEVLELIGEDEHQPPRGYWRDSFIEMRARNKLRQELREKVKNYERHN